MASVLALFAVLACLADVARAAPTITEFPVPTAASEPDGIAAGPDGNLWFTEYAGNQIGRITPSGTVAEFPVPLTGSFTSEPLGIAAGPDGNLWFTASFGNKIGQITPSGTLTEFPITGSTPTAIAAGPDGNLWFGEIGSNRIGRMSTTGALAEFPLPELNSNPNGITTGPDGNLWFTEYGTGQIGQITPTGTLTEFPLPSAASEPLGIAWGSDGNLWFTELNGNKIGRITPSGTITEFPLPTAASEPSEIAAGPDGNLWFTEFAADQIGRITPTGTITEFPVPTAASEPSGIAAGPDGNLWFTEFHANKIGRVSGVGGSGPDPTSTTVSCSPQAVSVGQPTTCTATVTDTAGSGQSTPTGTVSFSSNSSGSFSPSSDCTLSGAGASASCQTAYTPSGVGSGAHTITASYGGDPTHQASTGSTSATVSNFTCDNGKSTGGIQLGWPPPLYDGAGNTPYYTFPVGVAGQPLLLSLPFADSVPQAATGYSATVDWGDGSSGAATVSSDANGNCSVSANYTYASVGHYSVGASLTSPDNRSIANPAIGVAAIAPASAAGVVSAMPMIGVITGNPVGQHTPAQCTATVVSSQGLGFKTANGDVIVTAAHCGLSRVVAFAPDHTGISPRYTRDYGSLAVGSSGGTVSDGPDKGQTIGSSPYGVWRSSLPPVLDPNDDVAFWIMNSRPPGVATGTTLEDFVGGLSPGQANLATSPSFDIIGYDVYWNDTPWHYDGNAQVGAPDQQCVKKPPNGECAPGLDQSKYPGGDAGPHACLDAAALPNALGGFAAVQECHLGIFSSGAPWIDSTLGTIDAIQHGPYPPCCVEQGTFISKQDIDVYLKKAETTPVGR